METAEEPFFILSILKNTDHIVRDEFCKTIREIYMDIAKEYIVQRNVGTELDISRNGGNI